MSSYPSVVQLAATNLAKELNIAPDQVEIRSATQTEWSDSSLGCPEPGRMYTQALVRGYLFRIDAGGTMLEYHAGGSGRWLYCPAERAIAPVPDASK